MDFFKQNIIPGEVLIQLIAFLIVFWTLKKLAWKPVLNSLEARRMKIKENLDGIETAKQDIEKLKTEYTAHIQKIDDEARSKIQQAIDEGRRISREIQDKARVDAQATFEKSKENLAIEIEKAKISLRRETANLVLQVAEKVIEEKMTDEKQQEKTLQMIEAFEKDL